MTDKKKVTAGLKYHYNDESSCMGCPYHNIGKGTACFKALTKDALEMLNELEAVEPIPPTDDSDLWQCGNCNHQLFRCTQQRYCEMCGRKVKWE